MADMCYFGLSVIFKGNMDSREYCNVLKDRLLPFAADNLGERWTFEQDGASVHRSKYTTEWLKDKKVDTLAWQANSPDLIIIENVWGIMSRRVYGNARLFDNLDELCEVMVSVWDSIWEEYIQNLFKSIPPRLVQVTEKKGDPTDY